MIMLQINVCMTECRAGIDETHTTTQVATLSVVTEDVNPFKVVQVIGESMKMSGKDSCR